MSFLPALYRSQKGPENTNRLFLAFSSGVPHASSDSTWYFIGEHIHPSQNDHERLSIDTRSLL